MESPLGIDDLCELIGGKPADLARLFGVTDAAVNQWRTTGLPPGRALEMERKLAGKVRAADIKTSAPKKRRAA